MRFATQALPSAAEMVAVTGSLAVLAALAFGRAVVDGGFHYDDWRNASDYQYVAGGSFLNGIEVINDGLGGRPLLAMMLALPHAIFGLHLWLHTAYAAMLAVLACVLFVALLRALGARLHEALAMGALALLFPWSSITKIWATAGINNLALILVLAGALLLVKTGDGSARDKIRRLAALVLFGCSALVYEAAVGWALVAIVVDAARIGGRQAVRRLLVGVGTIGGVLTVTWLTADGRSPKLAGVGEASTVVARDAVALFSRSLLPWSWSAWVGFALGIVVVVALAVALGARWHEGAIRGQAPRWIAYGLGGVAVIALSYVPFVDRGLFPLHPGISSRVNIGAAFGYAVTTYSVLALASDALLSGRIADRVRLAIPTAAAAALMVAYGGLIQKDIRSWNEAFHNASLIQGAVNEIPPERRPRTVYVSGFAAETLPGFPVFIYSGDLTGAVRLAWGTGAVRAFAVFTGARLRCGKDGVVPVRLPSRAEGAKVRGVEGFYADTLFVNVSRRTSVFVRSRAECRRALRELSPGRAPSPYD